VPPGTKWHKNGTKVAQEWHKNGTKDDFCFFSGTGGTEIGLILQETHVPNGTKWHKWHRNHCFLAKNGDFFKKK